MKPENTFIASVHRMLAPPPRPNMNIPVGLKNITRLHKEKMHNTFRSGTADVWYSGRMDLWIEYKWVPRLGKKITPKLSPNQKLWLNGRWVEGRNVKVVVGSPNGCIVFRTPIEWLYGVELSDAQVLTKAEIARWIEKECGLAGSQGHQSDQDTSTPLSSTV